MNFFARNPWGWSVFGFWLIWYSYLFTVEDVKPLADFLVFFLPWLVMMTVFIGDKFAGTRSNAAFWRGYYVGRESEKQLLPYSQIPDDAEEVDWEYRLRQRKGTDNG